MNEFDDLADLDEVFGPLRSPARPAELSQESATVDLMVKAHRTSEGNHMFTSRRARIATLVAAGVLGFGGMAAAASPSFLGDEPTEEPTVVVVVEDEQPVDSTDTGEEVPGPEMPVEAEPVAEEPVPEESVEEEPVAEVSAEEAQVEEAPAAEEPVEEAALAEAIETLPQNT